MPVKSADRPETDDKALLSRVANQDKEAFECLYRAYYHRIFQFVLRMVKDPQLTDEIVGDTMFSIWQKAEAFEERSRVSTWIFGVAYRRALKALQKDKRHRQHLDFDEDALERYADTDPETNPEINIGTELFKQHLERGIEKLSIHHQSVMRLSAMGYAYHEIAEIIGCPQNTVKTRMFHARRQLKVLLAQFENQINSNHGKKLWPNKEQLSVNTL